MGVALDPHCLGRREEFLQYHHYIITILFIIGSSSGLYMNDEEENWSLRVPNMLMRMRTMVFGQEP